MDIDFNNINELYERLTPALNSKIKELRLLGINYIDNKELFDYLSKNKWKDSKNLTLFDMVDDILHIENSKLEEVIKNKILKGNIK